MKDAIVAEHSLSPINQIVVPDKPQINERLPDGRFAPGNNIAMAARGFQKISGRVNHILETKDIAAINYKMQNGQFENMLGIDGVAYRRARDAIYGLGDAVDVVNRIDGPVVQKTELTGKNGGPVTIVTADATELLMELSGLEEK